MQLSAWHDSGQYLDYRGHRIFYRVEGQGPELLLIHGFPTSSWDWKKVWPELTRHYRCITLDMLGFGYSSKPRQKYLISEQADIFENLLDTLGVEAAHLIAHDYGDTVAQELLSRQLDGELTFSIQSLHLLNGGLFPETHRALLIQKLMLSPCGGLLARLFSRKKLEKNFRKIFGPATAPSQQEIDDFWQLITHNRGQLVMHRLMDYMNQRRQYRERWVSALQKVSIPTRLTVGLSDPISGAHMVERYRELIPNPDIVELENIGHYPNVEAPARIISSITNFLRTQVRAVS